ncbi:hypothetical protein PSEUDO8Z_100144 [Pseudomonas sp. 8Z]|nr:hypothetical protein PSEUDO8Z_100144 [Pseudomonas sp. 8Z]
MRDLLPRSYPNSFNLLTQKRVLKGLWQEAFQKIVCQLNQWLKSILRWLLARHYLQPEADSLYHLTRRDADPAE